MPVIDRSNWRPVRLGDVVREINQWDKEQQFTSFSRCIRGEDIDTDGTRIRRWGKVPEDMAPTFGKIFRAGQVLYHTRSPNLRKYSQVDFDGYCGEKVVVLETLDEQVLVQDLIPYILQTEHHFKYALRTASGSTNKFTSWRKIAAYEFLLPPLEQQHELVELMQGFEAAIEAGVETLEAARRLDAAAISELLNSDERGQPIELKALAQVDGIQTGPFGSQLKASEYVTEGIPMVMPKDIQDGVISIKNIARVPIAVVERLSQHVLREGDIVFARRGDLSKIALIDHDSAGFICGTGCLRFRPSPNVVPLLLMSHLASSEIIAWLNENAVGTTMPNLNSNIIGRIPVPDMRRSAEEKLMILERLSATSTINDRCSDEIKQLQNLRSSVLNSILTPSTSTHALVTA